MLKEIIESTFFGKIVQLIPDDVYNLVTAIMEKKSLAEIKKLLPASQQDAEKAVNFRIFIYENYNPFELAVERLDYDTILFLSAFVTDLNNCENVKGDSALQLAAFNGKSNVVELLLRLGAKPEHQNDKGYTALMHAAQNGHLQVVQQLIAAHRDLVNMLTLQSVSALHIATSCDHDKVVKLLIQSGANVDERASNGQTAAHIALEAEKYPLFDILFQYGEADVTLMDFKRRRFNDLLKPNCPAGLQQKIELRQANKLRFAILENRFDILAIIISNRTNVNLYDDGGSTALHHACTIGNMHFISLLLKAGASPDLTNKHGEKPIDLLDDSLHDEFDECVIKAKMQEKEQIPEGFVFDIPIGTKMYTLFAATNSISGPQ